MKRLPPAKRNQLIAVVVATVTLIGIVYIFLIRAQDDKNKDLGLSIYKESKRLKDYEAAIKQREATTAELESVNQQLRQAEADVASGDLYAWTVDTLRRYKAGYRVEIPTIGQPVQSDCDLLGGFPYKQLKVTLTGTAYYHDLGKFISDFENKYPHCRVANLAAEPASDTPGAGEKLNFRMEIIALVQPNS